MYKFVTVENIENEHICCAMNEKKSEPTTSLKKAWMKRQYDNGLAFEKLDVRGKVFIEYLPVEYAFTPVIGENQYYINCLWVSGKYKGKGYGHELLDRCVEKAKEDKKDGIIAICSNPKRHFLSDTNHLKHYGFEVIDTYPPDFELLYYEINKGKKPYFKVNEVDCGNKIFYSHQCPHTEKYVKLLMDVSKEQGIHFDVERIDDYKAAKNVPTPITTFALFLDGNFVTNEILTEKKFLQVLKKHMLIE